MPLDSHSATGTVCAVENMFADEVLRDVDGIPNLVSQQFETGLQRNA